VWEKECLLTCSGASVLNLERNKIMFSLQPIQNLHKESFFIIYFFSPFHQSRNHDANCAPPAYISALDIVFSQVAKNG
jgi:hypothetical protein